MHVAVIGAGASGLATVRNLLKIDCTVECFERNEAIGGTWFYTDDVGTDKYEFPVYASMYSGMKTNLPKEVMGYSDFKFPDQDNSYVSFNEVLSFLNSYADQYNLRPHIELSTVVKKVRPLPKNRWSLKILDLPTKQETVKDFDAVVVCSGHFNFESYPSIPGRDVFRGKQVHSHYYRKPEPFTGKKVLIIGAGPSGLEISVILSEYAESVIISHHATKEIKAIFPAKVIVKMDVTRINETGVDFADATSAEIDCIIYCTGYITKFPFLTEECKIVVENDRYYIHPLYKHMINVEFPTMCIIGLPSQSCSLPLYDLQVRYYMEYLKGAMQLPTKEIMYEETAAENDKRKEMGLTNMHLNNADFAWDYYKDLADSAKIENTWRSIVQLRMDSAKQIMAGNLLTYRNDKYRIVDKDNYVKLN